MDQCSYCTYTGNWELCSTKGAYCKKDDWIVRYLLQQLAEARAEIERLTERLQANAAKIDEEDVVIEWADYLELKAEARQEAARECLLLFYLALDESISFEETYIKGVKSIKAKFGLEG